MKEAFKILNDLKTRSYKPIYFLAGEEPYYIDQISNFIETEVLNEAEKEFNQTVLYGRDVSLTDIVNKAKRYPMMGEHQVVIVKEAQNIKDFDELEPYISNPLKSTILVICYKYKSLDKRKKIVKTIEKAGYYLETKKLYDYQVPAWINDFMKGRNCSISPKAAALLTEFLGSDLSRIANEIEKLMLNIEKGTEINPGHIEKFIGISKDYNNFELNKALGTRDVLKANQIIHYFGNNPKNNPFVLTISSLYGYFCNIMKYHYANDKSERAVASVIGVHPFFVKEYVVAAKNYDIRKTVEVIGFLRDYDLKSKGIGSGQVNDGDLLKELIYKILH